MQVKNIYLKAAYDVYSDRLEEVEEYLNYINILHNNALDNKIAYSSLGSSDIKEFKINSKLESTMYSSIYLIIYNLIESTCNSLINSIHENISANRIEIHALQGKLYRKFLRNFQSYLSEKNIAQLDKDRIVVDSLFLTKLLNNNFNKDKEGFFSGNIDYRTLTKVANEYGFKITPISGKNFESQDLLVIKNRRNKLAHGAYSFSECGKQVSFTGNDLVYEIFVINGKEENIKINTINNIFKSVRNMLDCLFTSLDDYLREQRYLNNNAK